MRLNCLEQMLSEHKFYVKVVVDIESRILASGGKLQSCLRTGFTRKWQSATKPLRCSEIADTAGKLSEQVREISAVL